MSFGEYSFQECKDMVDERMKQPFQKDFKLIRVPPVYRPEMIEYMKQKYFRWKIDEYELSGIWVYGDVDVCTEVAIRDMINDSMILHIFQFQLDQVFERLKKQFPSRKFEIQTKREIYVGTDFGKDENLDERVIVIDDFELQGKWHPCHILGKITSCMINVVKDDIDKGKKLIKTDHNEELIQILRKEYPNKYFEIKSYNELFPWDPPIRKGTVIVVDNFVVPKPKHLL